jgi:hypothetical protein
LCVTRDANTLVRFGPGSRKKCAGAHTSGFVAKLRRRRRHQKNGTTKWNNPNQILGAYHRISASFIVDRVWMPRIKLAPPAEGEKCS